MKTNKELSNKTHIDMRVRVTAEQANLFEALQKVSEWYRPGRLRELALLGLAVESGRIACSDNDPASDGNTSSVASLTVRPAKGISDKAKPEPLEMHPGQTEEIHYSFPPDSSDAMDEIFAFLGN